MVRIMVHVLFQTESHYPVNRKKIKDAIVNALTDKVFRKTEVSLSVVGDRQMKVLNKKYRNIDKTTNVLSFPLEDPIQPSKTPFIESPDDVLRLGDIVISFPEARLMAISENKLVDDVIVFLALHGLDHLMGKHHE
ncbi:rRNA maturation RNase YbeY [Patescibacteria group bacterium]|nr:rRNA maturation RNase YbeY [Patescibacteria group bacterium]